MRICLGFIFCSKRNSIHENHPKKYPPKETALLINQNPRYNDIMGAPLPTPSPSFTFKQCPTRAAHKIPLHLLPSFGGMTSCFVSKNLDCSDKIACSDSVGYVYSASGDASLDITYTIRHATPSPPPLHAVLARRLSQGLRQADATASLHQKTSRWGRDGGSAEVFASRRHTPSLTLFTLSPFPLFITFVQK